MNTHVLTRPDGKTYNLELTPERVLEMQKKIIDNEAIVIASTGDVFYGKGCKLDRLGSGKSVFKS